MTAALMLAPSPRRAPFPRSSAAPSAPPARPPVVVVRAALVVDQNPTRLDDAVAALAAFPDAEVKCATTLAEAEWLARRRHFDLALVDVTLPDGGAVALIRRLAGSGSGGRTLCVARTPCEDHPELHAAFAAGAGSYVCAAEPVTRLRAHLLAAVRGEPSLAPAGAGRAGGAPGDDRAPAGPGSPAGPPAGPLSPRESEVLALLARGLTIAEVAGHLGVSENTVKAHAKRTYAKLDVRTRLEAARAARRLGLVRGDDAPAASGAA